MGNFICEQCTGEDEISFPTLKALVEHKRDGHKLTANIEQKKDVLKRAINPPIVLKYKYEGTCETCKAPLDTIEVIAGETLMVVAYCSSCKKQYLQESVLPMSQQPGRTRTGAPATETAMVKRKKKE